MEGLESRTLLATIPAAAAPIVDGAPVGPTNLSTLANNIGGVNASESSSVVAVDPVDPSKLVAVWIDNDPTLFTDTDGTIESVLEAAYSTNAGANWSPMLTESNDPELLNPATSGPTKPYEYVSSPSLGFDASGNVYILSEYSGGTSGALALQKYNFTGSFPTADNFTKNAQTPTPYIFATPNLKVVYQWDSSSASDQALDPTMTVDDNQSTIPTGVTSQADPYSGDVYVSWASVDVNTAIPISPFNPNRIKVEVSSDGGNNFSPLTVAGAGNVATEHDDTPATHRQPGPATE